MLEFVSVHRSNIPSLLSLFLETFGSFAAKCCTVFTIKSTCQSENKLIKQYATTLNTVFKAEI